MRQAQVSSPQKVVSASVIRELRMYLICRPVPVILRRAYRYSPQAQRLLSIGRQLLILDGVINEILAVKRVSMQFHMMTVLYMKQSPTGAKSSRLDLGVGNEECAAFCVDDMECGEVVVARTYADHLLGDLAYGVGGGICA